MHRLTRTACLAACALGLAHPALAQDTTPAKPAQQAREKPVYDEAAQGEEQIAAAIERAKKNNKRVLVQWGANWCGWCIQLHDHVNADRELDRKMLYEYEWVHIDIGKWDKHLELAQKLDADFQNHGVPFLTVLDAEGNVLANQETGSLEAPDDPKHSHDSAKLMEFLTEHQAEPLNADAVLQDALSTAREDDKLVFLHFGAPWCGWCHRLEKFLAREDIHAILGEHFVDVKIDTDRMVGGGEMLTEMRQTQRGGIPWFAFLDAQGKPIAHSSESGQNLGYPAMPEEADAFLEMLAEHVPGITAEQRVFLKKELVNSIKPAAG